MTGYFCASRHAHIDRYTAHRGNSARDPTSVISTVEYRAVHLLSATAQTQEVTMPTFYDPGADAGEASEALRGLAHATRTFENPQDL